MSSDQTTTRRKVKCPQCGSLAFYTLENPFRPFCSERCSLIDLGAWASGKYTIPVQNSETLDQEIDQIDDQNHPVDHN